MGFSFWLDHGLPVGVWAGPAPEVLRAMAELPLPWAALCSPSALGAWKLSARFSRASVTPEAQVWIWRAKALPAFSFSLPVPWIYRLASHRSTRSCGYKGTLLMQNRPVSQERFSCKIGKNLLLFFLRSTKAFGALKRGKKSCCY